MSGGEALVSMFVVSRKASHELLLRDECSAINLREKMPSGLASQDGSGLAGTKDCDISSLRYAAGEGQIAITLRIHCR